MNYTIFDTPDTVTSKLPMLRRAGIAGIVRYDDPSGNKHSWKQIGVAEYKAILKAGIAVGIVNEWGNNHTGYFSAGAGARDAAWSIKQAAARAQPKGSAIYGTVDFDVLGSALTGPVKQYFASFSKALRAKGYRVGCYGSGKCCDYLKAQGLIDLIWITCSSGFSGSRDSVLRGRFDLRQVFGLCDQTYKGLSVDWDASKTNDWGQVRP